MTLSLFINLAGGLGLILLGMKLMTDGLKLAGGGLLRTILSRWTRTPARGLFSGFFITSIVQASGAVTVAAIGFVNAGLMTLYQAVFVVYGSNIGTTTTAWIVAFLGLKLNIKALALPFITVGTAAWIAGKVSRRAALGEALAGFGLFFLGIEFLQGAFSGLGQTMDLSSMVSTGLTGQAVFVGIGFALTLMMQSSSAATALILTATASGAIPLSAAGASIIGANVGTTSTAAIATIGATPNAKRVAAIHVLFNLITGVLAFWLLPVILEAILKARTFFAMADDPAAVLALFHSIFNILGVLALWPVTRRLVRFVQKRFRTTEEDESKPRYLDKNIVSTPALAISALMLEIGRIGETTRRMGLTALKCRDVQCLELGVNKTILDKLLVEVASFTATMSKEGLPQDIADALPLLLRANRYFNTAAGEALEADKLQQTLPPISDEQTRQLAETVRDRAVDVILASDPEHESFSKGVLARATHDFESGYQELKQRLLGIGSYGDLRIDNMVGHLDAFSLLHRMIDQIDKGARQLHEIRAGSTLADNGNIQA